MTTSSTSGQSLDAAFGDSGDDWEEGGDQPDLMQGDSGNLFFLDDSQMPGSRHPDRPGRRRRLRHGGRRRHRRRRLRHREGRRRLGLRLGDRSGRSPGPGHGPGPADRRRWTSCRSGSATSSTRSRPSPAGSSTTSSGATTSCRPRSAVAGSSAVTCWTRRGSTGSPVSTPWFRRSTGSEATPLATVVAQSASQDCPILSGPNVWGAGNILLGGAGSDLIEGRGADDIIDGDRYLSVRLSVRTNPNDPATEIGSASVTGAGQSAMTSQYLRDSAGALTGPTLQQAVFAGTVDPGNIVAVREVLDGVGGTDTAVFSGVRANYTGRLQRRPLGHRHRQHRRGRGRHPAQHREAAVHRPDSRHRDPAEHPGDRDGDRRATARPP